jgi:flagellar assembly factor FliW
MSESADVPKLTIPNLPLKQETSEETVHLPTPIIVESKKPKKFQCIIL